MHVWVSGARGKLGSAACRQLTEAGHRTFVASAPPTEMRRQLWGYVDLEDAARACVLALTPRDRSRRFHALLIAAPDTGVEQPTVELLDAFCPDTERRAEFPSTAGLFDCRRAADVLGWTARGRWRDA